MKQLGFVGDHDQHLFTGQAGKQTKHVASHRPIQTSSGFIQEEYFSAAEHLYREGKPPLLPSAQPFWCRC